MTSPASFAGQDDNRAFAVNYILSLRAAEGAITPADDLTALGDTCTDYELESYLTQFAHSDLAELVRARRGDRGRYRQLLGQLVGDGSDPQCRLELSYAALRMTVATAYHAAAELLDELPFAEPMSAERRELGDDIYDAAIDALPVLYRGAVADRDCEWLLDELQDELDETGRLHGAFSGVVADDLPLALAALRLPSALGVLLPMWAGRELLSDTVSVKRRTSWIDTIVVLLTAQIEEAAGRLGISVDAYVDELIDFPADPCFCLDAA